MSLFRIHWLRYFSVIRPLRRLTYFSASQNVWVSRFRRDAKATISPSNRLQTSERPTRGRTLRREYSKKTRPFPLSVNFALVDYLSTSLVALIEENQAGGPYSGRVFERPWSARDVPGVMPFYNFRVEGYLVGWGRIKRYGGTFIEPPRCFYHKKLGAPKLNREIAPSWR